jgi:hypothetical protein
VFIYEYTDCFSVTKCVNCDCVNMNDTKQSLTAKMKYEIMILNGNVSPVDTA